MGSCVLGGVAAVVQALATIDGYSVQLDTVWKVSRCLGIVLVGVRHGLLQHVVKHLKIGRWQGGL